MYYIIPLLVKSRPSELTNKLATLTEALSLVFTAVDKPVALTPEDEELARVYKQQLCTTRLEAARLADCINRILVVADDHGAVNSKGVDLLKAERAQLAEAKRKLGFI